MQAVTFLFYQKSKISLRDFCSLTENASCLSNICSPIVLNNRTQFYLGCHCAQQKDYMSQLSLQLGLVNKTTGKLGVLGMFLRRQPAHAFLVPSFLPSPAPQGLPVMWCHGWNPNTIPHLIIGSGELPERSLSLSGGTQRRRNGSCWWPHPKLSKSSLFCLTSIKFGKKHISTFENS